MPALRCGSCVSALQRVSRPDGLDELLVRDEAVLVAVEAGDEPVDLLGRQPEGRLLARRDLHRGEAVHLLSVRVGRRRRGRVRVQVRVQVRVTARVTARARARVRVRVRVHRRLELVG